MVPPLHAQDCRFLLAPCPHLHPADPGVQCQADLITLFSSQASLPSASPALASMRHRWWVGSQDGLWAPLWPPWSAENCRQMSTGQGDLGLPCVNAAVSDLALHCAQPGSPLPLLEVMKQMLRFQRGEVNPGGKMLLSLLLQSLALLGSMFSWEVTGDTTEEQI